MSYKDEYTIKIPNSIYNCFKVIEDYLLYEYKKDEDSYWGGLVTHDWYNNEGGQGQVVWDLDKEEFRVEGEQNRYAAVQVKETYYMDGKQPDTWYGDEVYER